MEFNKEISNYKYIHLFSGKATQFHRALIDVLTREENGFNKAEHLFVTVNEEAYEQLKDAANIVWVAGETKLTANVINWCAKQCDWLFIHNLSCAPAEVFKIKKSARKKIIWRTWGSDAGMDENTGNRIKRIIKKIVNFFYKRVIRDFYAVGISNSVDKIDITKRYGNVKTRYVSYANKDACESRLKIKPYVKKEGEPLNILLGHSGFPNDNHISVLKKLKNYADQNICVYIVLSYGDADYSEKVNQFAITTLKNKVNIISEQMPYNDYLEMLSKMDIAILDGEKSYALGNLGALLFLEKKMVLNKKGVIREAFDAEDIPYIITDDIGEISFQEFAKPIIYGNKDNEIKYKKYEYYVQNWKNLFDELDAASR